MTRWCPDCETWWDNNELCMFCSNPGIPAHAQHHPARSWRNPADTQDHDLEETT